MLQCLINKTTVHEHDARSSQPRRRYFAREQAWRAQLKRRKKKFSKILTLFAGARMRRSIKVLRKSPPVCIKVVSMAAQCHCSCGALQGSRFAVHGWVKTVRPQKSITFLEVNDGSCLGNMQVIAPPSQTKCDLCEKKKKFLIFRKDFNRRMCKSRRYLVLFVGRKAQGRDFCSCRRMGCKRGIKASV